MRRWGFARWNEGCEVRARGWWMMSDAAKRAGAGITPSYRTMLLRALRQRCPNCGAPSLFYSWFRMREACPVCGLRTERQEEGYIVGAYMFNIVFSEMI